MSKDACACASRNGRGSSWRRWRANLEELLERVPAANGSSDLSTGPFRSSVFTISRVDVSSIRWSRRLEADAIYGPFSWSVVFPVPSWAVLVLGPSTSKRSRGFPAQGRHNDGSFVTTRGCLRDAGKTDVRPPSRIAKRASLPVAIRHDQMHFHRWGGAWLSPGITISVPSASARRRYVGVRT